MAESGPASFDDRRNFVAVEFPQHAETDGRVAHVDTGIVDDIEALIGRAVAPRAAAEQAFRTGAILILAGACRRLAVAHPFADVADEVVLGHKLFESAAGELCTTVEQRIAVSVESKARREMEARRVAWDGPARDVRPRPRTLYGFRDSSRDTVKPWEIDLTGHLSLSAAVHRFTASNAHVLATFGVTPAYMRQSHRGFSTFEFQLGLRGEVHAGDPLVVRSALVHVGNSSLRLFHTMLDERSGTEVASLEQSGVHFDQDRRRPAPLPDELRTRALALLVRPA